MTQHAPQWKGRTGGGTFGQKSLLFFFKYLNVKVGYFFVALSVPFYMLFGRKGYKAIYYYFNQRLGLNKWKSFRKTYQNHYRFGQIIIDRMAVLAGKKNPFTVHLEGNDYFLDLLTKGAGFVVAGSHIGSFELSGYLFPQDKKRINTLVFGGETATMNNNRQRQFTQNNINMIPVNNDLSHLFAINDALAKGEIVSMAADRVLGSRQTVTCRFLGEDARFPIGAFLLAAMQKVKVVSVFVLKEPKSRYSIYVKPIEVEEIPQEAPKQKAERLAKEYVSVLESVLRKYPEQWFNYYPFWEQ